MASGGTDMTPLLCRLGWHHPVDGGYWNQGYCFTTCRRCGRDMVKSLFGEWHVPRGFRIVWHTDNRAISALDAAMAAHEERHPGGPPVTAAPAAAPRVKAKPVPPAPTQRERRRSLVATELAQRAGQDSPFDFGDFDAFPAATRGREPAPPPLPTRATK